MSCCKKECKRECDNECKKKCKKFDYIIVGAGTAGAVLAKLLTDDFETSVLLLEAGTNLSADPLVTDPNFATALGMSSDSKYTFHHVTNLESPINIQSIIAGGRQWGGSSSHNFFYSIRGSPAYWNALATLVGDDAWNYDNISPFWIQNETYTGTSQSPAQRGNSGPFFIRQSVFPPNGTIANLLADALNTVTGIPIVDDYNVALDESISIKTQYNQKETGPNTFIRQSTATAYLNNTIVTQGSETVISNRGVAGRKLCVSSKSTVDKVILSKRKRCDECCKCHSDNKFKAKGVSYIKKGKCKTAKARKGVILSAYFNSANILQRSGIGRNSDLSPLGIPTLVNNPNVGHGFQTHVGTSFLIQSNSDIVLPILAEPGLAFTHARIENIGGPELYPRLQMLNVAVPFVSPVVAIPNGWQVDPNSPLNIVTLILNNSNPKSRGSTVISHCDVEADPTVKIAMFTDTDGPSATFSSDDVDFLVKSLQFAYSVVLQMRIDTPAKTFNVIYPNESLFLMAGPNPGGAQYDALYKFVLANPINFLHYAGSTIMATSAADGVVDSNLNVFGVDNLKVADVGILPILPDANTSIPAIAIGHRAFNTI